MNKMQAKFLSGSDEDVLTTNNDKSNSRCKKFDCYETNLLLEIIPQYLADLNNKQKDVKSKKVKDAAWKTILQICSCWGIKR